MGVFQERVILELSPVLDKGSPPGETMSMYSMHWLIYTQTHSHSYRYALFKSASADSVLLCFLPLINCSSYIRCYYNWRWFICWAPSKHIIKCIFKYFAIQASFGRNLPGNSPPAVKRFHLFMLFYLILILIYKWAWNDVQFSAYYQVYWLPSLHFKTHVHYHLIISFLIRAN